MRIECRIKPGHIQVTHPRAERVKHQAWVAAKKAKREARQNTYLERYTKAEALLKAFRVQVLFWLPTMVMSEQIEQSIRRHGKLQTAALERATHYAAIRGDDVVVRRASQMAHRARVRAAGQIMKCVEEIRGACSVRVLPPLPY